MCPAASGAATEMPVRNDRFGCLHRLFHPIRNEQAADWMALLPENTCLGKKTCTGLYLINKGDAHKERGKNHPAHDRMA